ncbi:MAG: hypothetical protein U9Q70_02985 [Chloroflexota bacterium]|nr:hypothetical protein [Chloroflexota bacterium]
MSVPIGVNNLRLQRFAGNLYDYPLPPNTEVLDRHAEVGLTGNGNYCDFQVEQSLVTTLTREKIEVYYQNLKLPAAGELHHVDSAVSVRVHFDETFSSDGKLHFTIELFDSGYPPGFDIRCH